MKIKLTLISLAILLLVPLISRATHYNGGYISYTVDPQSPLKYNFRLTMSSNDNSSADDPTVQMHMGDGNTVTVPRNERVQYGNLTSIMIYEWTYTYQQPGTYFVSWRGINRNPSIINIPQPSDQLSHYIHTRVDARFTNVNSNSVRTIIPPPLEAFVGEPFKMNLIAYDADGDEFTYELVPSSYTDQNGVSGAIPGYQFPAGLIINKFGELKWQNPGPKGEYALSVKISEIRDGFVIGYTVVDLQLMVKERSQQPRVTLLNKDQLTVNYDGSVLAKPNEKLKMEFFVARAESGTTPIQVRQFSDLDTLDLATPAVTVRDSADGKAVTVELIPEHYLIRDQAYIIGIRGSIAGPYDSSGSNSTMINKFGWAFVYVLIAEQQPTSSPEPLQQLAPVIYPNPVRDKFVLEAPALPNLSWQLHDATGKVVASLVLKPGKNALDRPADLPAGFYTYRISSNREVINRGKLVLE